MRAPQTLALVLTLALTAACSNEQKQTTSNQPADTAAPVVSAAAMTPEQLGELGAQMRKDPARANDLLAQRGLTQQSFEQAIRDVTEKPDEARRYAAAYRKASA